MFRGFFFSAKKLLLFGLPVELAQRTLKMQLDRSLRYIRTNPRLVRLRNSTGSPSSIL